MSMFRKQPAIAEAVEPERVPERAIDDPEPPKIGPDGYMNPAYSRWEWRESERRLRVAAEVARVGYTPPQDRAVLGAQRARDEARAALQTLEAKRAYVRNDLRTKKAALDDLHRQGYAPMSAAEGPSIATLEKLDSELGGHIGRARAKLNDAEGALSSVEAAADADVERRRALVR